ncbi:hypothetical protein [Rhizobium sp. NFR07]|uniref:hypothetical protein n=1 Tax=Rhizobium sp. NFR07 TaxID=1566262 RepID=UPI000B83C73A|nr:hypothetical protein [Rhizobium sp. NFR07]
MDDWRGRISDDLERMVDRAVAAGARQEDVFAEVAKVIEHRKSVTDPNRKLADTTPEIVVDEPANNWPAADK